MERASDGKSESNPNKPLRKSHVYRPFETRLSGATINWRAHGCKGYCGECGLLRRMFARRISRSLEVGGHDGGPPWFLVVVRWPRWDGGCVEPGARLARAVRTGSAEAARQRALQFG